MKLIQFLHKESGSFAFLFVMLGLISGLSNAAILQFIDTVISDYNIGADQEFSVDYTYFGIYTGILFVLLLSQRIFQKYLITLTEKLVCKIRLDILNKVRFSNYAAYEQIGQEKIYASLTKDTGIISTTAGNIVYASTSIITVFFCLGYLAYRSMLGFGLTILTIVLGIGIYWINQKRIFKDLDAARNLETRFFKYIDQLLSGFKEVKVDKEKNKDIYHNYIEATSFKSRDLNTRGIVKYLDNSLLGTFFFFLLIGFILFFFPALTGDTKLVISFIFILLYIMGPIEGIMTVIPGITQANISISHIEELNKKASEILEKENLHQETDTQFNELQFENVVFEYKTDNKDEAFQIGPVNLTIHENDFLFIAGGNGSGKTTFFKVLTGLYKPTSGTIRLNGEIVNDYVKYRDLFAPIYSDFHLFDRFYGMEKVNEQKVNDLIRMMQLEGKVTFKEGRFSDTALSTGQRKRLALIVSLVEEKPILVLDEWAADQDPQFRQFFYESFLPKLKKEGKTIIAITHDDKYFHVANQLYKMEYGKFIEKEKAKA